MLRKPSLYLSVRAVFKKDALSELRSHYAFSSLIAFSITALSSLSMSISGSELSPRLLAALLWVVLFFSAMAGLARVFVQEQDAGTLFTLRVYALPQGVFFGKIILNVLLLSGLSVIILPLFLVFFDVALVTLRSWLYLGSVIFLGLVGMAVISTLTAAMAAQAQGRSALFTVLTFPLILPEFLSVIQLTGAILAEEALAWEHFIFLGGYDVVAVIAGSIIFDYLWTG